MKPLSVVLPGTWKLISRIDCTRSGERRLEPSLGEDPVALLFYDQSGYFAAQFMKRDRSGSISHVAASASNNSRAQDGYNAYFGTYTIDETEKTVTQRLVGALSKENVGLVVTRMMLVEGDTLTIKLETTSTEDEAIIRTLIWSRVS
jgi:hypothetical protein